MFSPSLLVHNELEAVTISYDLLILSPHQIQCIVQLLPTFHYFPTLHCFSLPCLHHQTEMLMQGPEHAYSQCTIDI